MTLLLVCSRLAEFVRVVFSNHLVITTWVALKSLFRNLVRSENFRMLGLFVQ